MLNVQKDLQSFNMPFPTEPHYGLFLWSGHLPVGHCHLMAEIPAEVLAQGMSSSIIYPDNSGFASVAEQEGTVLEGTENNATAVTDGDKRVKRRLLMGTQPSLFLGHGSFSLAHCSRPKLRAHVS